MAAATSQRSRHVIFALGVSLLFVLSCNAETFSDDEQAVEVALEGDDQCGLPGSNDADCALNALQLSAGKGDISVDFFRSANSTILSLQPYVLKVWTDLSMLEVTCNTLMVQIQNLTGKRVIWNAGYKAPPPSGRRRRRSVGKGLPIRTKYIMKLVMAVNKEMKQFWHKYAIVDRKRVGILNDLTIYPYGPSKAEPELAQAAEVALDEEDQDVLDEEGQLALDEEGSDEEEADEMASVGPAQKANTELITDNYEDLLKDIKDSQNKTANLTGKVDTTKNYVNAWIAKR